MLLASVHPVDRLIGWNRRRIVAFIAIGSFFGIFLVAILWATRPESKRDAKTHGTKEQDESILLTR
jgi:hypothetical protein